MSGSCSHSWAEGPWSLGSSGLELRPSQLQQVTLVPREAFSLQGAPAPLQLEDRPPTPAVPPWTPQEALPSAPASTSGSLCFRFLWRIWNAFTNILDFSFISYLAALAIGCRGLCNPCWKTCWFRSGAVEPRRWGLGFPFWFCPWPAKWPWTSRFLSRGSCPYSNPDHHWVILKI